MFVCSMTNNYLLSIRLAVAFIAAKLSNKVKEKYSFRYLTDERLETKYACNAFMEGKKIILLCISATPQI